MKIFTMIILLFILASCGGGRYHRSVVADCKIRNLSDQECTDRYYHDKYGDGKHHYHRTYNHGY